MRQSPRAVCLILAAAALAVRLAVMPFLYQENLDPERDHWMFGHEQGRVARSIVLGQGFSNPLFGPTGPTAYPAPVFPYFMAGVFNLFGIYSKSSAIVIIAINCLFSALTVIPLYFYALPSFGERTALIAGCFWVIFPYSVYWTIMRIWDTWISTLLLSILFLLALKLAESDRIAHWAGFGLLWGFTGLLNPVALAVLPGLGLWMIYSLDRQGKRWLQPASAAVVCVVAMVAPWMIRNYMVFHKFIPIRDSLGLELYVGNDGQDALLYDFQAGPWKNVAEWERFQRLGEIAYFEEKGGVAAAFIKAHPGSYAVKSLRRWINVWTDFWSLNHEIVSADPYSPLVAALCTLLSIFTLWGLWQAWHKDAFGTVPYLIVLFCYPLVYCFTHTADWYRRPIDPFFVVLAAYGFVPTKSLNHGVHRGARRFPET
jgi:4-amino-4-deoxy-L-arabinose transferase-like glycosyltransferase